MNDTFLEDLPECLKGSTLENYPTTIGADTGSQARQIITPKKEKLAERKPAHKGEYVNFYRVILFARAYQIGKSNLFKVDPELDIRDASAPSHDLLSGNWEYLNVNAPEAQQRNSLLLDKYFTRAMKNLFDIADRVFFIPTYDYYRSVGGDYVIEQSELLNWRIKGLMVLINSQCGAPEDAPRMADYVNGFKHCYISRSDAEEHFKYPPLDAEALPPTATQATSAEDAARIAELEKEVQELKKEMPERSRVAFRNTMGGILYLMLENDGKIDDETFFNTKGDISSLNVNNLAGIIDRKATAAALHEKESTGTIRKHLTETLKHIKKTQEDNLLKAQRLINKEQRHK